VVRARFRASLACSRERREQARRLRRRRLRTRGGALSLAAVALCIAVAGATVAVGRSEQVLLKSGAGGPAVAKLQRKLGIPADGAFGPGTERAVKRFQRRRGLSADGVVGPATARALGLGATTARSARQTSSATGGAAPVQVPTGLPPELVGIAECESGGDPRSVSRDGRYRGKYQFTRSMWTSMGGKGDPARAPEPIQDRLALKLYSRSGTAPWPSCG
jgi:resuscitation-promoting factor RpfB